MGNEKRGLRAEASFEGAELKSEWRHCRGLCYCVATVNHIGALAPPFAATMIE